MAKNLAVTIDYRVYMPDHGECRTCNFACRNASAMLNAPLTDIAQKILTTFSRISQGNSSIAFTSCMPHHTRVCICSAI